MTAKRLTIHAININDIPGSMHNLLIQLATEGIDLNAMIVSSVGGGKGTAYLSAKDPEAYVSVMKRKNIATKEMSGFLIIGKDRVGSAANALDPLAEAGINGIAGAAMVCDNKFGMIVVVGPEQGDAAEKLL